METPSIRKVPAVTSACRSHFATEAGRDTVLVYQSPTPPVVMPVIASELVPSQRRTLSEPAPAVRTALTAILQAIAFGEHAWSWYCDAILNPTDVDAHAVGASITVVFSAAGTVRRAARAG